jgi:hypothetical protein
MSFGLILVGASESSLAQVSMNSKLMYIESFFTN